MMTHGVRTGLVAMAAAAAAVMVGAGCSSVRPYPVRVTIDERIQNRSVQVDIVAVSEADYQTWEGYSMSQYWRYGDPWRRDADKFVMRFGQDTPSQQTLAIDDPIWERWLKKGGTRLLVLGDLPEVIDDRSGAADPRRLVLPLMSGAWDSPRPGRKNPVDVRIESGNLRCLTPFDPEKMK